MLGRRRGVSADVSADAGAEHRALTLSHINRRRLWSSPGAVLTAAGVRRARGPWVVVELMRGRGWR